MIIALWDVVRIPHVYLKNVEPAKISSKGDNAVRPLCRYGLEWHDAGNYVNKAGQ